MSSGDFDSFGLTRPPWSREVFGATTVKCCSFSGFPWARDPCAFEELRCLGAPRLPLKGSLKGDIDRDIESYQNIHMK